MVQHCAAVNDLHFAGVGVLGLYTGYVDLRLGLVHGDFHRGGGCGIVGGCGGSDGHDLLTAFGHVGEAVVGVYQLNFIMAQGCAGGDSLLFARVRVIGLYTGYIDHSRELADGDFHRGSRRVIVLGLGGSDGYGLPTALGNIDEGIVGVYQPALAVVQRCAAVHSLFRAGVGVDGLNAAHVDHSIGLVNPVSCQHTGDLIILRQFLAKPDTDLILAYIRSVFIFPIECDNQLGVRGNPENRISVLIQQIPFSFRIDEILCGARLTVVNKVDHLGVDCTQRLPFHLKRCACEVFSKRVVLQHRSIRLQLHLQHILTRAARFGQDSIGRILADDAELAIVVAHSEGIGFGRELHRGL